MTTYFDFKGTDEARRKILFEGGVTVDRAREVTTDFVLFTRRIIEDAFGDMDPVLAQHHLSVEEYVEILAAVKPFFINHPESKRHLSNIIESWGMDPEKTYFDVPRLRTSTSDNFLVSGISYSYHAHRDTWYAAPMCQQNWWMPVYEMESGNGMAIHPSYFDRAIANGSGEYSYERWVKNDRKNAANYVTKDTRKQPHPEEPISMECEQRFVLDPGAVILFSGAHLHSSVPNNTGKTRFSIDFRTVHMDDLLNEAGAPNVDGASYGTNLGDFFRASDHERLPAEIVQRYATINQRNAAAMTAVY